MKNRISKGELEEERDSVKENSKGKEKKNKQKKSNPDKTNTNVKKKKLKKKVGKKKKLKKKAGKTKIAKNVITKNPKVKVLLNLFKVIKRIKRIKKESKTGSNKFKKVYEAPGFKTTEVFKTGNSNKGNAQKKTKLNQKVMKKIDYNKFKQPLVVLSDAAKRKAGSERKQSKIKRVPSIKR